MIGLHVLLLLVIWQNFKLYDLLERRITDLENKTLAELRRDAKEGREQ